MNLLDPIILFDGVCNLCNGAVQFVIRHDDKEKFTFASLQSETGQKILVHFNLPTVNNNSFVLVQSNKAFTKSTAALLVAKQLNGPIKLLYAFIIIPAFVRNAVYSLIAKNRYKWFGKKETCMMPTHKLHHRFLK